MTHSRRTSWDGKPLAVNGGDTDQPADALHNSAVVGSSNAPVEYDPHDYTVDEVVSYVANNPDQRDAVLDAELAGKNRTTLIAALTVDADADEA